MKLFILYMQLIFGIALSFYAFSSQAQDSLTERTAAASYFQNIRDNFAKPKDFSGTWISSSEREKLLNTYSEEKPNTFIDGAKDWLKKCPVDAKVHLMLASLLIRTGDYPGGVYHRSMFYGLLSSILVSGDGKTPKTAFRVISSDEEYTVMNFIGAKIKNQKLDGMHDVMDVEIDGKTSIIYFDVSIGLEALGRKLKQ